MLICECTYITEDEVLKALNAGLHPSEIHQHYGKQVVCGSCLDKIHLMYRALKVQHSAESDKYIIK